MAMASGAVVSDLDAFEEAIRAESRPLYSLANAILGDQQEAEDAVQDTMELAWRSWRTLRDPMRRSAWLKRICIRRCLRVKRRLLGLLPLSEQDHDQRPWPTSDPDLDRIFRRLSRHQRAVIRLHYHDGYSLDECAALMGCRPGTVRSHLARALASFRQELSHDQ
jgi:RNA polymerase sigma factor (sigma-70 family)